MLEMLDKICLDNQLKIRVISIAENCSGSIINLAERCNNGDFNCLSDKDDLTRLAVMIECASSTYSKYKAFGIDDKVFYDTIDDIRIWCENNGNKGLKEYGWIKNHIAFNLFRLGRLQFQLYKCENPTLDYSKLPFEYGERLIYIHIPQGEKLILSDCIHSIKTAKEFFGKYFPEYSFNYFFCESWLLYEGNIDFMDPHSNIIRFASLFDIAYSCNDDSQAIERIFGRRRINKHNYSEDTSLQKRAKAYLINGGRLGMGIGVIDANDF